MVDSSSGSMSRKHRWRGKLFDKSEKSDNDQLLAKYGEEKLNINQDQEVDDFLRPSIQKSRENSQQLLVNAGVNKPKIDVAAAQRWPGAHDIAGNSTPSPGLSGLPSSLRGGDKPRRKLNLGVSFARTAPEIIGEGGDESEIPSIEVSKRKANGGVASLERAQTHQDDIALGLRSQKYDGIRGGEPRQHKAGNADGVKRHPTSAGEMSPPLQQKMEMRNINSHAPPPQPPPQRLGPMGLGDRPRPLQRAPTGFDVSGGDDVQSRPSLDSTYSFESEHGLSPVAVKKEPTIQEEEDFVPKPLRRTQTGWSEHMADSDDDELPLPSKGAPLLPEMGRNWDDDDSPLDLKKHFLQSEPTDPDSFSARLILKMRAEEGAALHHGSNPALDHARRDSTSTTSSFNVGSPPKASYPLSRVAEPPRSPYDPPAQQLRPPIPPPALSYETPTPTTHSQPQTEPHRSHARKPSQDPPIRKPLPSGSPLLDTDMRPSSSSSANLSMPKEQPPSMPPISDPQSASTVNSVYSQPTPASAYGNSPNYYSQVNAQAAVANSLKHSLDQDPGMHPVSALRQDPGMHVAPRPAQDPGMQVISPLARSDTRSQGDAAFHDFADRVTHMQGIFRLTAELSRPLYDYSPMQWLRASMWWFLRGRVGMEGLMRSRPKGDAATPQRLTQPHVDLAKTWWILTEIIQNHPGLRRYGDYQMASQAQLARQAGDVPMADVYEVYDVVLAYLKLLLASMKRHHVMPPTQALIQGQDQTIWLQYPHFAPDAQAILSGSATKSLVMDGQSLPQLNPATSMPLGDTKSDFCYFRMFVQVSLSTEDAETDRVPMTCVLSVLRPREDLTVKLSICSESDLVNVQVQGNPKAGPTWDDVKWKVKTRGMYIRLPRGFTLNIDFNDADFRSLWAIVEHTNKVGQSLRPQGNERVCYDLILRDFQYKDPTNPQAFPQERVKRCRAIIFEQCARSSEGSGKRRLHRGYRMLVVTPPKNRTLSCINHDFCKEDLLDFEFESDKADGGYPVIVIRAKGVTPDQKRKTCTLFLVFNEGKERNKLFGTLTGMNVGPDETVFASVPLKGISIENADQAEGFSHSGRDVLKRLQWQDVKALNQDPQLANLDVAQTVLSESLRVVARHSTGNLTDRMNLSPGELLMRLQTSGDASISLLRNPQEDFSIALDTRHAEPDIPESLAELLRTLTTQSTLRTLYFHNLQDLHAFQMAITGFYVKYDGIAASLSIARRRMVVPIYKQWTSQRVRLQIVIQDSIVQLLAFFTDFSHADAMNFVLKSTDVFERNDKGGSGAKYCVRLVDAKFALPVEERKGEGKMEREEGMGKGWAGVKRRFVCVDVVEYPGEHDDIVLGFETKEERDRFAEALPASTSVERKITFKRKI